ncbi:MAG TPA: hypothetical protein VMJ30_10085 [Gemmatimonadales bacterium]|nr:hypothetical protein [Gemmatimonadales bacterium]
MQFGRRLRFMLGLLALVFGSGAAGPWLEQWHDCPAQMAAASMPGMDHHDMGGHEQGRKPGHSSHHRCECFCSNCPVSLTLPTTSGFGLRIVLPTARISVTVTARRQATAAPHFLPFALPPPPLG